MAAMARVTDIPGGLEMHLMERTMIMVMVEGVITTIMEFYRWCYAFMHIEILTWISFSLVQVLSIIFTAGLV